jgi:hypothetical protein
MKTFLAIVLCASSSLLQAMRPDMPQAPIEKVPLVSVLSEQGIEKHKQSFQSEDSRREFFRGAALVTGIFGATFGATYRFLEWRKPKPQLPSYTSDLVSQLFKNQQEEITSLRNRVTQLEGNHPAPEDGFLVRWGKIIHNKVVEWTPGLVQDYARNRAYNEFTRIAWGFLPFTASVASLMFDSRSLNTCMLRKTNFYFALQGLMNWGQNVAVQPDLPTGLEDLSVTGAQFIGEMEKIVGYMEYVVGLLKPEQEVDKRRAILSIKQIKDEIRAFVQSMNTVITHDRP